MPTPAVLQSSRIPFLILGPACVFLGAALSHSQTGFLPILPFLLTILGAISAHIAVNTFNEYQDFRSGLDLNTTRTPFSGGSGALNQTPDKANLVLLTGILATGLTIACGLYLAHLSSYLLLPIGLIGIILITSYTPWINRFPWLCLIAPGLGFGLLMVNGSVIALGGSLSSDVLLSSLIIFLTTNNLLLLNQYPDIKPDKQAGRNHLTIQYGVNAGNLALGVSYLGVFSLLSWMLIAGLLPIVSAFGLVMLVPAGIAFFGAKKYGELIGEHPLFMAANVIVAVVTPVILGVTILL